MLPWTFYNIPMNTWSSWVALTSCMVTNIVSMNQGNAISKWNCKVSTNVKDKNRAKSLIFWAWIRRDQLDLTIWTDHERYLISLLKVYRGFKIRAAIPFERHRTTKVPALFILIYYTNKCNSVCITRKE